MSESKLPWVIAVGVALGLSAGCDSSGSLSSGPPQRPVGVDLYVAGVHANQAGDPKLAQTRFEQATSVNPKLMMARSVLGDMYRAQGDYGRALQQYNVLIQLDPYSAENYYRLGVTYQFMQKMDEAIANYFRALKIQPTDARSTMNLGLCYLSLSQQQDAVTNLRKAVELSPNWADAWTNLGVSLDAGGDLTGAEEAYKHALELDRNQTFALLNLGANLIRQNKPEEAVGVMQEAVKRSNTAANRTRFGHALVLVRRFDDARSQFQYALQLDPRFYTALNERGFAFIAEYEKGLELDDNCRRQAVEAWKQSLTIDPKQPAVEQAIKQWGKGI